MDYSWLSEDRWCGEAEEWGMQMEAEGVRSSLSPSVRGVAC